jgi:hypothetical protein
MKKRRVSPKSLANLKSVKPGQVLNPAGRPKGSRNKLGEDFIADMHKAWGLYGIQAIAEVVENRPADFLKVVAGILPKEMHVKDDTLDNMSHDDIIDTLAAVRRLIAERAGEDAGDQGPKPAGEELAGGVRAKH